MRAALSVCLWYSAASLEAQELVGVAVSGVLDESDRAAVPVLTAGPGCSD
jgi:hypothetical protein